MTHADWLALAGVIVTAVYSGLTYGILRANKATVNAMQTQQEALNRPYIEVSVWLRTGTILFYLSVKNVGRTSAQNVRLTLDRPLHSLGKAGAEANLQTYSAFSRQIDSIPPGTQLQFLLGTGPTFFAADVKEELTPKTFSITADYEFAGKRVTETTPVDLRPFFGTDIPHDAVADELQKLRETLQKMPRDVAQEVARHFESER